jgi:hypothetical protein
MTIRLVAFNSIAAAALVEMIISLARNSNWDWKKSVAGFAIAALAALIGNLDYIETFKASINGVEARTREVVRRAEVAMSDLQTLAASFGTLLVQMVVGQGRPAGFQHSLQDGSSIDRDRRKQEIIEKLKAFGLSDELISEVEAADRKYVLVDYRVIIQYTASIFAKPTGDLSDEWTKFVHGTYDIDNQPNPVDFRKWLTEHKMIDSRVDEFLKDYEYYWNNGKHRRPEIWQNRREWITATK